MLRLTFRVAASRRQGNDSPTLIGRRDLFGVGKLLSPHEFVLDLNLPSADRVGWNFEGKWQFFYAGYDPRKTELEKTDQTSIGTALNELPGGQPARLLGKNVWSQGIRWEGTLDDSPVTFPAGRGNAEIWLVRVRRLDPKTVELETPAPPSASDVNFFLKTGYKSEGEFKLKTPGTVQQLSGPSLSKSWFSNTYSTKFNLFKDQRIVVRIAF